MQPDHWLTIQDGIYKHNVDNSIIGSAQLFAKTYSPMTGVVSASVNPSLKKYLKDFCDNMNHGLVTPVCVYSVAKAKGANRAMTKTRVDYTWDIRKLLDVGRGMIVIQDPAKFEKAVCDLRKWIVDQTAQTTRKCKIVYDKDRWNTNLDPSGYKDFLTNIECTFADGTRNNADIQMIFEVQVQACPILWAKQGNPTGFAGWTKNQVTYTENGHKIYEGIRKLDALIKSEPDVQKHKTDRTALLAKSVALYNRALEADVAQNCDVTKAPKFNSVEPWVGIPCHDTDGNQCAEEDAEETAIDE
jgi:hypothetical protein